MTEFTASNGGTIRVEVGGRTTVTDHTRERLTDIAETISRTAYLNKAQASALREFFQHERDEALGRWRWPENPDYVVYSNPDEAFERMFGPNLDLVILRDSDGMTKGYVREEDQGGPPMDHRVGHVLAARAYFEAHPERKPWHAPDAGDHWVLHIAHGMALSGDEHLYKYTRWGSQGRWGFVPTGGGSVLDPTDPTITAGRRIWPEDAS
ncbi:hypothetical protein [Microbacterium sp. NPDC087592]|uniref:hypothetical protein n=1 Tax=Microbacterium sp. NPDC087592 TaxID=3364193 RepID=UPI0038190231